MNNLIDVSQQIYLSLEQNSIEDRVTRIIKKNSFRKKKH